MRSLAYHQFTKTDSWSWEMLELWRTRWFKLQRFIKRFFSVTIIHLTTFLIYFRSIAAGNTSVFPAKTCNSPPKPEHHAPQPLRHPARTPFFIYTYSRKNASDYIYGQKIFILARCSFKYTFNVKPFSSSITYLDISIFCRTSCIALELLYITYKLDFPFYFKV